MLQVKGHVDRRVLEPDRVELLRVGDRRLVVRRKGIFVLALSKSEKFKVAFSHYGRLQHGVKWSVFTEIFIGSNGQVYHVLCRVNEP